VRFVRRSALRPRPASRRLTLVVGLALASSLLLAGTAQADVDPGEQWATFTDFSDAALPRHYDFHLVNDDGVAPGDPVAVDASRGDGGGEGLFGSFDGEMFDQGSWYGTAVGSVGFEQEGDRGRLRLGQVGFGYFFVDRVSVNVEIVMGAAERVNGPTYFAGGFDVTFRWHFVTHERFSLYLEGGSGVIATTGEFPVDGAGKANFHTKIGGGATVALTDRVSLMGGLRVTHVSNAGFFRRNPGIDSLTAYLGVMVGF